MSPRFISFMVLTSYRVSKTDRSLLLRPVGIMVLVSRFASSYLSTTPLTGEPASLSGHTTNGLVAFIGISPPPGSLRAAPITCDGSRMLIFRFNAQVKRQDGSIIMTAVCHRRPVDTDPPAETVTVLARPCGVLARSLLWLPLPGATAATYLLYRIFGCQ